MGYPPNSSSWRIEDQTGAPITPWLPWDKVLTKAIQLHGKRLVPVFTVVEKGVGDGD